MGGAVSSGKDNDDLIDNLVDGGYIKTVPVERVFRAVDRGMYYLPDAKALAYRDQAWKEGLIHLSAPCIYTEVLESFKFEPGMAFLNLGSGTGYLSTLVGLLIGANGTNHGVEVHESNVQYATERLEVFLRECVALRYFDFAVPTFLVGNALSLGNGFLDRYDRIYVGAACEDEERVAYLAKFLKIGGFMIIPNSDNLVRVIRTEEAEITRENLMQCSFANLLEPTGDLLPGLTPPKVSPPTLKFACRLAIIRYVREKILSLHPELFMPRTHHKHTDKPKPGRRFRRVIFPLLLAQNDDEDAEPQIVLGDAIQADHNGNDGPDEEDLAALQAAAPPGNVVGAVLRLETRSLEPSSVGRNAQIDSENSSDNEDPFGSVSNSSDEEDQVEGFSTGTSRLNFSPSTALSFRKRRLSSRTTSESQTAGEAGSSTNATKRRTQLAPGRNRSPQPNEERAGPSGSSHSRLDSRLRDFSEVMSESGRPLSASEKTAPVSELEAMKVEDLSSSAPMAPHVPHRLFVLPEKVSEPESELTGALPAVQQMEILSVQTLKRLPIPRSFQRFLNFDRPLDA